MWLPVLKRPDIFLSRFGQFFVVFRYRDVYFNNRINHMSTILTTIVLINSLSVDTLSYRGRFIPIPLSMYSTISSLFPLSFT